MSPNIHLVNVEVLSHNGEQAQNLLRTIPGVIYVDNYTDHYMAVTTTLKPKDLSEKFARITHGQFQISFYDPDPQSWPKDSLVLGC